ncbi:hypothetical protein Ahy_A09g043127 [Arachis hypogaea]|uniref:Uncharacterized protein n=1 Tax=Arachis hypogaea TaxID=3818 RepID=A0A445BHK1_ARAHY|nr:hypothetical protein Ahy_A09g043127 [Arachis hypogaea]
MGSKMEEYHWRLALAYDKYIWPRMFLEGDMVLKSVDAVMRKMSLPKWAPKWEGPYIVSEKTEDLDGGGASSDDTVLCKKCPSRDDEEHLSPTLPGVLSPCVSLQIQLTRLEVTGTPKDILEKDGSRNWCQETPCQKRLQPHNTTDPKRVRHEGKKSGLMQRTSLTHDEGVCQDFILAYTLNRKQASDALEKLGSRVTI